MEGKEGSWRSVAAIVMVLVIFVAVAEAGGNETDSDASLRECYRGCYPKCDVHRPLWCASFCIAKCKHSKSIPDNICNCTYSCSKFMCEHAGSDADKVHKCVMKCSKFCNIKY